MASSSSSPCAACKFLRRKCVPGCVFAPYFPQDDSAKFVMVHRAFGASNVAKILGDLSPMARRDAVTSLCFEAEVLLADPIQGCHGYIHRLSNRFLQLKEQINAVNHEIGRYVDTATMDAVNGGVLLHYGAQNFAAAAWGIHRPPDVICNQPSDGMSLSGADSTCSPGTTLGLNPSQQDSSSRLHRQDGTVRYHRYLDERRPR